MQINDKDMRAGDEIPAAAKKQAPASEFTRFRKVFFGRPVVIVGFVIVFLLILSAVLAPVLAPYDPYKLGLSNSLSQPSGKN